MTKKKRALQNPNEENAPLEKKNKRSGDEKRECERTSIIKYKLIIDVEKCV